MNKRLFLVAATFASACTPVAPAPEPPPPPPRGSPHFTTAEIQGIVEQKVQERLGAEALRAGQAAQTSVMAASYQGRFDAGGPRTVVAVRTSGGWMSWTAGRSAPIAAGVGAELDRLLADPALWREEPFYPAMDCPDSGATMMVIRHGGRTRVTRQGCTPAGLTGKLEETVLSAP